MPRIKVCFVSIWCHQFSFASDSADKNLGARESKTYFAEYRVLKCCFHDKFNYNDAWKIMVFKLISFVWVSNLRRWWILNWLWTRRDKEWIWQTVKTASVRFSLSVMAELYGDKVQDTSYLVYCFKRTKTNIFLLLPSMQTINNSKYTHSEPR
jgi:hypothetical protein